MEFRRHRFAAEPFHKLRNYALEACRSASDEAPFASSHPKSWALVTQKICVRCQFKSTCTPHARRRPTGQILDRVGGK